MTQPILSLNRLSQVFDGVTAVDALTMDIAKGEIFGFLGHNGAGKTTTVQMLTTLAKPASGTATVAGAANLLDLLPAGIASPAIIPPVAVLVLALMAALAVTWRALTALNMAQGDYNV